jgi:hypothetical protein
MKWGFIDAKGWHITLLQYSPPATLHIENTKETQIETKNSKAQWSDVFFIL